MYTQVLHLYLTCIPNSTFNCIDKCLTLVIWKIGSKEMIKEEALKHQQPGKFNINQAVNALNFETHTFVLHLNRLNIWILWLLVFGQ